MEYFSILNLNKEPFSNSPDPDFFFESPQHVACLQKVELSIRLRRGLNVVIGDVGTGKTTLCRQLIRMFSNEKDKVETYLLLDPGFTSPLEFLSAISEMFGEPLSGTNATEWQYKERIKKHLFRRGVDEKKIVILIIDEGQKIPDFGLEILREFLNYETNEYKLFQLLIFAQKEFDERIKAKGNFEDRISLYYHLGPLNYRQTRSMIRFRLAKASSDGAAIRLFSPLGLMAIYFITGGYPRKIVTLCNRIMFALIVQNRTSAGLRLTVSTAKRIYPSQKKWRRWAGALASLALVIFLLNVGSFPWRTPTKKEVPKNIFSPIEQNSTAVDKVDKEVKGVSQDKNESPLKSPPETKLAMAVQKRSADDLKSLTDKKALSEYKPVESSDLMPTKVDIKATPTLELKFKPIAKKEKPLNNLSRDKTGNLNKGSRNDKFPAILGQLRVANGDTLSDMIHKVYGVYLKEYLPLVSKTNHLIDNVDILPVGSVVNFPAIPQANSSFFEKGFWVQFVQKNELKDAYRFVRNYPKNVAPVQILPYWNKNTGLKFIVLLNSLFYDKSSAMKALESIPSDFASEAKILTQWEKGTTFFASLNKRK